MRATWPVPCWNYTEELLHGYIYRPTGDAGLTSIRRNEAGELTGFLCYVPYELTFASTSKRCLFGSFWTSDRAAANTSFLSMPKELIDKARARGYSGLLAINEPGSFAERSYEMVTRFLLGTSPTKLREFETLLGQPRRIARRIVDAGAVPGSLAARYEPEHRAQAFELLRAQATDCDLAWAVPEADVDFLLGGDHARTWLGEGALLNVRCVEMLLPRKVSMAHLDHCVLPRDPGRRGAFLATVFADPFWEGIAFVSTTDLGPTPPQVFTDLGFIAPAGKRQQLLLSSLDETRLELKTPMPERKIALHTF
tara:strand:+ start:4484 stop:5413 length:930 start_codon:yes stop_codon:yes gene_type:complete